MIIRRQRGDTYDVIITVTDDSKAAIELTTETFQFSISTTINPTTAPDVYTVAGTIIDGPNGQVGFAIDGAQDVGEYYYDIQMTDINSKIRTIAKDKYIVDQDITK